MYFITTTLTNYISKYLKFFNKMSMNKTPNLLSIGFGEKMYGNQFNDINILVQFILERK